MKASKYSPLISCALIFLIFSPAGSTSSTLDDTWQLTDLYENTADWQAAYADITQQISQLSQCRGKLNTSAEMLAECLQLSSDTYKKLMRLYTFSMLSKDIDLGDSTLLEQHTLAQDLETSYSENISFLEPELLSIDESKLQRWQKNTPALKDYDFLIRNALRNKPHVLSAREEQILAAAGAPLRVASTTYGVLANAEIPRPEITLSNGEQIKLTPSAYTRYRSVKNRADRKAVFDNFFASYQDFAQTLAVTLSGQVQAHTFEARMRGYSSALQLALSADNIPEQVYRTLLDTVNNNLATLHRYLKLRAQVMDIDDPHYYDVYPAVADLDRRYSIEDSNQLLLAALKPLGEKYQQLYSDSVGKRWMHVPPADGKRSGAYSMGAAYDVHPYILLNHNDDFESLTTFAHEWGHTMHSLLATEAQPFAKADYATFIAEIASTSHEILLYKYLQETAASDEEKLYYLFQELQGLRGTFFRQTQFAEFELAIHEEIEKGGALSADKLNLLYGETLKRYYGHDQKVMGHDQKVMGHDQKVMYIDDMYAIEWAYIPHFYRNFYVFQYATSISAAYYLMENVLMENVLMENVLTSEGGKRQQYLSILEAGGSDYPYDILKRAGVDMASPEVYEAVIRRCNKLMDEIETILQSR